MHILVVDSVYGRGGAAVVAENLSCMLNLAGHTTEQIVGHAPSLPLPENVREISQLNDSRQTKSLAEKILRRLQRRVCEISNKVKVQSGRENFNYPLTKQLLRQCIRRPDILHCHNLHGNFFDLRQLKALSRKIPVLLTMHDSWLLTGHCAHSFYCNRWIAGCGECPDLSIPPAIPIDRTRENWRAKAAIYRQSALFVSTPSKWLMERVRKSMLNPGVIKSRVIPNGVDLQVFRPYGERNLLRKKFGWKEEESVLLFLANGIRFNPWKDYATLHKAAELIGTSNPSHKVRFVALGEEGASESFGRAVIEWIPFVGERARIRDYLRAADLYVHASKADTFPNTVIEALATGLPVVATAVGGIPEQVKCLDCYGANREVAKYPIECATGVLTLENSPQDFATAIGYLIHSPQIMDRMRVNARRDAEVRFSLQDQARSYIDFYEEMIEWKKSRPTSKASKLDEI